MTAPIIQVENLHKNYKIFKHYRGFGGAVRNLFSREYQIIHAVNGIDFKLQAGELVGYLGPNGAGKSTTIKMLTGLLVPTSGKVFVNGQIPWQNRSAYVRHIGAVFGQRTTLWWDLPVIESLDLLQHIYRIPADQFKENLRSFRNLLDLDPFLYTPVRSLSLGQRMRADLCAALLHDPVLLFLDEPTIGLDVVAKERIREFIQYVNRERGVTVILTTHDLTDVEKLCERVLIIDHGRLLFDNRLDDLRNRFGGKRMLRVEFAEAYSHPMIDGAELVETDSHQAVYAFSRDSITASELIQRLSARYRLVDLSVQEPAIEDTIRRIYEEKLLEPPA
jgi:ABC-2 type transport system ATP-binding protein